MVVPYGQRRWRWTGRRVGAVLAGIAVVACVLVGTAVVVSLARAPGCESLPPPDAPVRTGRLPGAALRGHPVAAAASGQDLVFVSLRGWGPGDVNGIEVLRPGPDGLRSTALVRLSSGPAGLLLSPDGKVLLAAEDDGVAVLDAARAAAGDPSALLGIVPTGGGSGTSQLAVAANRYLFTADEAAGRVTVLDLPRIEAGDFGPAVQVATIDVDMGPAGLDVSPDGRYVYVVSQVQRPVVSVGPIDFLYGLVTYVGVPRRAGILSVIDIKRMQLDPLTAVVARVPAGCGPVRVAASPDGRTVWVAARQSNELLAFRTDALLSGRDSRPAAGIPIPAAPGVLGLVRNGRFALVGGSDGSQAVAVVDTGAALAGQPAVRTSVTVGGQPREIAVTPDGRTAYVADEDTSRLTMVDLPSLLGS